MKIVFFTPNFNTTRSEKISYRSVQEGSGFSGTETALIEVASYLSKCGHEIYYFITDAETYTTNGITVCSPTIMEDPNFVKNIDIFSPIFFVEENITSYILSKLNPQQTKIWLWFQCFINDNSIKSIINMGFKVIASFLSPYVRDKYDLSMFYSHITVGNAIGDVFMTENSITSSERKGNVIFHASYERGGNLLHDIINRVNSVLPDNVKSLNYASYYTLNNNRVDNSLCYRTVNHGSLSKIGISNLLSNCDYFVYPLVLPDGQVHHDTYGSVILEALSRGTIVITWNVACIPCVYSDYVVKIEPKRVDGYEPFARFSTNRWMLSDEAIDMFANKIIELEANPDEKERLRANGIAWAQTQTWEDRGKVYNSWLSDIA